MFEGMGNTDVAVLDQMEASTESYLKDAIARNTYRGWLAEVPPGRVVAGGGVVIAQWPGFPGEDRPRRAWILNIYTDLDYRRRGTAKQITETIIDWCRSEGFATVSLHASREGRPLYETLGFQPTNEMRLKLR